MPAVALAHLPDWPAAMNREAALAYTGVAETQLRDWIKSGRVRFRPRGPRGQMVALRAELDAALAHEWAAPGSDVAEDLDFG